MIVWNRKGQSCEGRTVPRAHCWRVSSRQTYELTADRRVRCLGYNSRAHTPDLAIEVKRAAIATTYVPTLITLNNNLWNPMPLIGVAGVEIPALNTTPYATFCFQPNTKPARAFTFLTSVSSALHPLVLRLLLHYITSPSPQSSRQRLSVLH